MGREGSLFSLFGVLMPKGEKSSIRLSSGFARVGHKFIRFDVLFAKLVPIYRSVELFALQIWFVNFVILLIVRHMSLWIYLCLMDETLYSSWYDHLS